MKRFNVTMTIEVEENEKFIGWKPSTTKEAVTAALEDFYYIDIEVSSINVEEVGKALPIGDYRGQIIDVFTEDGKLYAGIRIITGEYKGACQRWRIG